MKKYIAFLIILILVFPALQSKFNLFNESALQGAYEESEMPEFSIDNFINGTFQEEGEAFLKDKLGLKNSLIRLNNQIDYTFFSKSNAAKVVVGKEEVLYESNYLDGYYGKDYVGDEKIHSNIHKFKELKTLLNSYQIELFLIIAPGKASFFPEYFPSYLDYEVKSTSNYDKTVDILNKESVSYLDLRKYFTKIKQDKKYPYPLFPRQGIHWSSFGIVKAADTIYNFIEKSLNRNIIDFSIDGGTLSNVYQGTDYDIGDAMNLMFKNNNEELYYPNVKFNSINDKIKALIIGDSFVNGLFKVYPFFQNSFNDKSKFWYYNQEEIYPGYQNLNQVNKFEEIINSKAIIILFNEQNIGNFDYGFIDNTLKMFYDNKFLIKSIIESFKTKINNNEEWSNHISEKAKKEGISFDEMIGIDAKYMCKEYLLPLYTDTIKHDILKKQTDLLSNNINENSKDSVYKAKASVFLDKIINDYSSMDNKKIILAKIEEIKANEEWYNSIVKKAKQNSISIEEQLSIDAKWIIENP